MASSTGLLTPPVSPAAKQTLLKAVETNAAPDATKLSKDELSSLLGFRENLCPSLTKDDLPCKRPSTRATRPAVANLFETMLCLTQASPNFSSNLQQLAQNAHCPSHQHNRYIEASVKRWSPLFPGTPPISEQLRQAVSQESRHCFYLRKQDDAHEKEKKCENRGGRKVQHYAKTIPHIVEAALAFATGCEAEREELDYLLQVLAYNALCEEHQFHKEDLRIRWEKEIFAVLKAIERPLTPLTDTVGPGLIPELNKTTSRLGASPTPTERFDFHSPQRKEDNSKRDPSKHWPSEFDENGYKLIGKTNAAAPVPSHAQVGLKLQKELNEALKETEEGFVYIYKIKGHDDLVKIGFTQRTVADRHEDWQFSCNRKVICIYPEAQDDKKVKYARRIEALCHAQLAHCKTEVYCDACMSRHIEWFKIDDKEAIAIVKSWSKWAQSEPYEKKPNQNKKSEKDRDFVWPLRAEQRTQLDDLPSFMQRLSLSAESDTTQAGVAASKAD